MNKTIFKRIQSLKDAIMRMDDISVVSKETDAILSEIDKLEGEEKICAMGEMMNIAIEMMKDIEGSEISKLVNMLNMFNEPKKEVKSISVNVKRFLDGTVVEVSEKISYSELLEVLENVQENFKDEVISLAVDRRNKCMEIEFMNSDDMTVPVKHWKLCDESKDVYMEGFAEYLECIIK